MSVLNSVFRFQTAYCVITIHICPLSAQCWVRGQVYVVKIYNIYTTGSKLQQLNSDGKQSTVDK